VGLCTWNDFHVCVLTHRDVFGCPKYKVDENRVEKWIQTKHWRNCSQQCISHAYGNRKRLKMNNLCVEECVQICTIELVITSTLSVWFEPRCIVRKIIGCQTIMQICRCLLWKTGRKKIIIDPSHHRHFKWLQSQRTLKIDHDFNLRQLW